MIQKFPAQVIEIKQLSHDTKSFIIQPEKPVEYKPGQFIMVNVPYKDTFVRRAYSIASKERDGTLEICLNYLKNGIASEYFFNLSGGEQLLIDGPYGIFTLRKSSNTKLFICTGTGVAPLRAMIHALLENGEKAPIVLIFGERTEEELLYRAEFEELMENYQNFTYVPTLSRANGAWKGERGYVQQVMKKYINDAQAVDIYICGIKEMVQDVTAALLEIGVEKKNIFTEKFV